MLSNKKGEYKISWNRSLTTKLHMKSTKKNYLAHHWDLDCLFGYQSSELEDQQIGHHLKWNKSSNNRVQLNNKNDKDWTKEWKLQEARENFLPELIIGKAFTDGGGVISAATSTLEPIASRISTGSSLQTIQFLPETDIKRASTCKYQFTGR